MFAKLGEYAHRRFGVEEGYVEVLGALARCLVYEAYALAVALGQCLGHAILDAEGHVVHAVVALVEPFLYGAVGRRGLEELQLHLAAFQEGGLHLLVGHFLYAYTGFPRSLNGLGTLQAVVAERKEKGLPTTEGRDASPLPKDYDALKQGTEVQTKLSGKAFDYTFAPATDYYLKAHLFGDIFARDVLSHTDREIVTVSALASMQGVEPQLLAHVRGARNMGVSDDELRALPAALGEAVGEEEGYRAGKAIAQVLGDATVPAKPFAGMDFPKGEPNTAYAQYFIGNSYLAPLLKETLPMANVTFEPRCRNNWHVHHKAHQILICVGGEGWYQAWGKPARRLKAGDVVDIPAEEKHWHGATADSWFQHIAIHVGEPGATNEWLEDRKSVV